MWDMEEEEKVSDVYCKEKLQAVGSVSLWGSSTTEVFDGPARHYLSL